MQKIFYLLFWKSVVSYSNFTYDLLVNPSFELQYSNKAINWQSYNGEMNYNIICTDAYWSCSTLMKKYNIFPFYGTWFTALNAIPNNTYSALITQKITFDFDINKISTSSLQLQFWYSSSGTANNILNYENNESLCSAPEIHVYLAGQHLFGMSANSSHEYTLVNYSVFQSWMSVENGMEFMMEIMFPNPNCDFIPYIAIDNVTLTWQYSNKRLVTENILYVTISLSIIIFTFTIVFFAIRINNLRKRRSYVEIPVFPSRAWFRYMYIEAKNTCKKTKYELV